MIPTCSTQKFLERLKSENCTLHLFTNNANMVLTMVTADLIEMTGLGYASKILDKDSWTIQSESGKFQILYNSVQTFNFTNGNPVEIWGSYIKWNDGTLCAVNKLSRQLVAGLATEPLTFDIQPKIGIDGTL